MFNKIEIILNNDEYAALSMKAHLRKRKIEDQVIHILKQSVGSGWETPPVEWYDSGIKPPDGRVIQIRSLKREELPEDFQAYYDFILPDEASETPMVYAEIVKPDELPEEVQTYTKDILPEEMVKDKSRNTENSPSGS